MFKNIKLKIVIVIILTLFLCFKSVSLTLAGPVSGSFELLDYGFGAGGSATSSSSNYMFQGILGEVETGSPSSANYTSLPGLTYMLEPNTPGAPNFTNPSNYYNKLKMIIDDGANSTDTTFLIQIASNSADFSNNAYYIQTDNTLGSTPVWQTYSAWGGATGFNLIGLFPGTTYFARVTAKRGIFQQGKYSATAQAATSNPTLTFSVQTTSQIVPPFTVFIGNLTPGAITTSSDKITATITTNANTGGLVYIYGSNNGLKSTTAGNHVITSATNDLTLLSEGYGARGTTITQVSGGPMQFDSPYSGAGDNIGIIDTSKRTLSDSSNAPVIGGQTNFELKAKASNTTPSAGDYTDIITLIGTGNF